MKVSPPQATAGTGRQTGQMLAKLKPANAHERKAPPGRLWTEYNRGWYSEPKRNVVWSTAPIVSLHCCCRTRDPRTKAKNLWKSPDLADPADQMEAAEAQSAPATSGFELYASNCT